MDIIFWTSAALLGYIYLGYPMAVRLIVLFSNKTVKKALYLPHVTIVIAAYNEEKTLRATVENKLALDYPKENMEIIVVSDGSTDRTDAIVEEYEPMGVRLMRQEHRRGKTAALNRAIQESRGEIIVFSDANSLYAVDALNHLTANFADKSVGYVTGKLTYGKQEGTNVGDGCSRYMRYENFLRKAETGIGSIVGVNGGIDAVRNVLYEPMSPDQIPDFILPLKVVEKGYRVVYDPDAILKEDALETSSDEYRMRVRVALRSLHAIRDMKHLLNPFRFGLFSWQFLSHKALRYLAFVLLLAAFICNLLLIREGKVYQASLFAQSAFYIFAFTGWYLELEGKKLGIFYVPYYFCLLNVSSAHAFLKMLKGIRQETWEPRKG